MLNIASIPLLHVNLINIIHIYTTAFKHDMTPTSAAIGRPLFHASPWPSLLCVFYEVSPENPLSHIFIFVRFLVNRFFVRLFFGFLLVLFSFLSHNSSIICLILSRIHVRILISCSYS